jgi:hypothetical protein
MKNLLVSIVALFFFVQTAQAQDRWLYWKYKDYNGSISFAVPRWAIHTGSWFLNEKSDRKLLRRVHKARVMVFEDGTPVSDRDVRRFNRKAKRHHLEEILTVRDGKTRVQVMARERRNALRKVVVFVNSPEDGFVMVSLKGKLRIDDVNKAVKKIRQKEKKDSNESNDKPLIPNVVKMPVDRA